MLFVPGNAKDQTGVIPMAIPIGLANVTQFMQNP